MNNSSLLQSNGSKYVYIVFAILSLVLLTVSIGPSLLARADNISTAVRLWLIFF